MKNIKRTIVFMVVALSFVGGHADVNGTGGKLPDLHKIRTHVFTAPYSCGGDYELSALFLSSHSKDSNAPDLLYNGACGSRNYIHATTAGDDFALIADLGEVSLESVSAEKAFNYERTVRQDNLFKEEVEVQKGHTYAVLISKSDIRALYVLKVESLVKGGPMAIKYAVKSYSIQKSIVESPGFDWGRLNE